MPSCTRVSIASSIESISGAMQCAVDGYKPQGSLVAGEDEVQVDTASDSRAAASAPKGSVLVFIQVGKRLLSELSLLRTERYLALSYGRTESLML